MATVWVQIVILTVRITLSVCSFNRMAHTANTYIAKVADNAKKNASAFEMANNKKRISKVKETFPEAFTDNMIEEEQQFTLCKFARE
jgi:hypothetical protein